jgi:hypothetical protein
MIPSDNLDSPSTRDPSGFWRFVFWLSFVLGSLALLFSWGLAQVPTSRNDPHVDQFVIHGIAATLLVIAIVFAKWLWGIRNPFDDGPKSAIKFALQAAWGELAVSVFALVALAVATRFH